MEFEYGGKTYSLGFRRSKESFHVPDPVTPGVKHIVLPNRRNKTTAQLTEWAQDAFGEAKPTGVVYQAESVCKGPDQFCREEGRKRALRHLSKKLNPSMRGLMWEVYENRPKFNNWVSRVKLAKILFEYGFSEEDLVKIWERAK